MAWYATGVSVGLKVFGGLFGGKGEKRRAKEARAQENAFRNRELDQADAQFDWTKKIYGENKERYDPIFDEMRESMDDVQPDYEAIAGDINKGDKAARGMAERSQRRYGIKPTSGAAQQAEREFGIARGASHVGARSAARRGAKDQKYARRKDLFSVGQGISSSDASRVTNAMGNQQRASRGAADSYGNEARYQDRRAAEDQAGWGNLAGGIDFGGIFNEVKGWGSGSGGGNGNSSGGRS